jgi:hypothetical protein
MRAILANSEGWKAKNPRDSHRWAPPRTLPMRRTKRRRATTAIKTCQAISSINPLPMK